MFLDAFDNLHYQYVGSMIFKWFNSFRVRAGLKEQPTCSQAFKSQWAKDYQLVAWGNEALFAEYLEMGMTF